MAIPYDVAHILARFNGHFGESTDPKDFWSFGIRFAASGGVPWNPSTLQTFADACRTAYATFHGLSGSMTGNSVYFDNVEVARIGTNGLYDPPGQLTVISTGSAVAGVGTMTQPWSAAMVISLRTTIPRGRGSNGRLYIPACGATLDAATGRVSDAFVTSRVNSFKTALDAMNTAAVANLSGAKASVMSSIGNLHATVNVIRSDGRMDNVERRENDQDVSWITATIA